MYYNGAKTSLFVNAETKCVRFYHPERKAGELLRLCRNDECICAEGKQEMTLHTFFKPLKFFIKHFWYTKVRTGRLYTILGTFFFFTISVL